MARTWRLVWRKADHFTRGVGADRGGRLGVCSTNDTHLSAGNSLTAKCWSGNTIRMGVSDVIDEYKSSHHTCFGRYPTCSLLLHTCKYVGRMRQEPNMHTLTVRPKHCSRIGWEADRP